MIPIFNALTGKVDCWEIDADFDVITCPNCRVCVPRGQVCNCIMRTMGPATENTTRKTLIKEKDAAG